MHSLVCDSNVWVCLLKQIDHFSTEKLEELVNFVGKNNNAGLMAEVLRAAANKFPSHPGEARWRKPGWLKIVWTVQGWDTSETFKFEPSREFCYMEELTKAARAVGIKLIILEIECVGDFPDQRDLEMIAGHVKGQEGKLANLEVENISYEDLYISLLSRSVNWRVGLLVVGLGDEGSIWFTDDVTDVTLGAGHIRKLVVKNFTEEEQVSLDDLKKIWQIVDRMYILTGMMSRFSVEGGRGKDPEAAWQSVLTHFKTLQGSADG